MKGKVAPSFNGNGWQSANYEKRTTARTRASVSAKRCGHPLTNQKTGHSVHSSISSFIKHSPAESTSGSDPNIV